MKILASDLDGTLIVNNNISKENIEAIHRLKENSGKFVISTGRTFNGVKNIIDTYPLEYDYLSLCNGGLIIDKNNISYFQNYFYNICYLCLQHLAFSLIITESRIHFLHPAPFYSRTLPHSCFFHITLPARNV